MSTVATRTVGRRKEAVARVQVKEGKGHIVINDQPLNKYFPEEMLRSIVLAALKQVGFDEKADVSVKVKGGGRRGQAEAIRHGIARALAQQDIALRTTLKKVGFLTRDSRVKERKKPGLKRARRAPQWAKR